jgi:hypothetical protein
MRPTCKIPAQLLNLTKSYSLPKLTTYTEVKLQFLGLQLSRQILCVIKNKSWSDQQKDDRAIQP